MGLTDKISTLIFALIVIAVGAFLTMSRFFVGPLSQLTRGERIILGVSFVGVLGVMVYAAVELLFHFVF
ncbi:MAG TPA: hypothetical protein VMH26_15480 [Burkholderiales bacterium]|nr:hypothetical protein [Burkholderiales bacterium]